MTDMDRATYLKLRERAESSIHVARKAMEDAQANLAALDRVWAMLHGSDPARLAAEANSELAEQDEVSVMTLIRHYILRFEPGREFTSSDVSELLASSRPDIAKRISDSTVSKAIERIRAIGDIVVTAPASGRRPATYRRRT